MKLYVLSKGLCSPCMVMKFKHLTIMLDCHLDLSPLLNYLPLAAVCRNKKDSLKQWTCSEIKQQLGTETNFFEIGGRVFIDGVPEVSSPESGLIDFSTIDVILLTNFYNILALPYVTEYSGFNGKVFATEPTLHFGRLYMEELVSYNESFLQKKKFTLWKNKDIQKFLPSPLCDFHDAVTWEGIYNARDVSSSISKIQCVGFSERIDVLGLIRVTAVSSGYAIGSSNWVLETDYHKICYISSSSTYATHSLPMEQNALKNSDLCILNSLTPTGIVNPDAMLRDFCSNLAVTLKNGGNVLIPCFPSGVIFDLFEYLCAFMDGSGLSFIPIYFISPVADSSLAYANIYAEWLNTNKQAKVYLPEPPFLHHELVKNGRIKHYENLHSGLSSSLKTPSIVFTGHPSLRFGDVVHFLNLWGHESGNTVIFIDSEFPYLEALTPYQPLSMKAVFCPIDPRLNFHQSNKLLRDIKPGLVVIPEAYQTPPVLMPQRTDLTINTDIPVRAFQYMDVIDIPLHKTFAKVTLSPEVAKSLCPKQIEDGLAIASVRAKVVTRDNRHTLKPVDLDNEISKVGKQLFGSIDVNQFISALKMQGINNAEVESTGSGHIIHFPDIDAMIQLEVGNTHIINHTNEQLRVKIKNAVLACLIQV
ncbi:integrator complex subunit 9 homolog isoform X2 [Hydra vulgaris]|uniref:Integrator complex subunit 9 homolog isoform X2 n=2 Tax=Hydra vulgaris TaxID=6087 RepID=A0ABM4D7S9_HYDVU